MVLRGLERFGGGESAHYVTAVWKSVFKSDIPAVALGFGQTTPREQITDHRGQHRETTSSSSSCHIACRTCGGSNKCFIEENDFGENPFPVGSYCMVVNMSLNDV